MNSSPPADPFPIRRTRPLVQILRIVLPIVVILGGTALAVVLVRTAPKAERKPPARRARLVEVETVRFGEQPTVVHAMGVVEPAREVVLHPQVSGTVVTVSPELMPGGRFREGDVLLRIDPADYELAVRRAEGDVAQAKSDLAMEQGQQEVAQCEYEMLGVEADGAGRDLVLRRPQLESVRARLAIAEAALEQARVNLRRATVKAPFNAVVRTRDVEVGSQVTPTTALASLTGTDAYWIVAAVPVDQLRWILVPAANGETGSTVRVYNEAAWGPDAYRTGHVLRLMNDLEPEGRMARLLVAVEDPLGLGPDAHGKPKLLLGDYVRAEIEGRPLENVAAIDRAYVHDGDQVWIMNERGELEIRTAEVAFRAPMKLLLRAGVRDGERLVVTDLASPVPGMPLRTDGQPEASAPPAGSAPATPASGPRS